MTYENVIIMGDFNIDINTTGMKVDKLDGICNLFDLTNLIKTETCCTKNHKCTIDLFLTNKPLSFKKPGLVTGIVTIINLFRHFLKLAIQVQNPKLSITETIRTLTKSFSLKI